MKVLLTLHASKKLFQAFLHRTLLSLPSLTWSFVEVDMPPPPPVPPQSCSPPPPPYGVSWARRRVYLSQQRLPLRPDCRVGRLQWRHWHAANSLTQWPAPAGAHAGRRCHAPSSLARLSAASIRSRFSATPTCRPGKSDRHRPARPPSGPTAAGLGAGHRPRRGHAVWAGGGRGPRAVLPPPSPQG